MPSLLMVLLRFVFNNELLFSHIAPALLGVFPFLIMFLITSITTLRERTTGTLERLMTMPIGRLDLLFGYALAFGLIAVAQVARPLPWSRCMHSGMSGKARAKPWISPASTRSLA